MKMSSWVPVLLMAGGLVLTGCKKSEKPAPVSSTIQVIDATNFRPAFASASPETKAIVNDTMMSIQSVDYEKTLADLAKLSNLPDLSEAQKKAVADLSDQVKRKMAQEEP
jgi:hypothetical protein